MRQVDMAALLRESAELAKISNIYNNQKIELHIQTDLSIQGDERELQSAVQNIIENAVKYSPADSPVQIDWLTTPENAVLSVRNRGEIIEHGQLIRLTERFYRIDKGRSRDKGGTGLGLSIVKHVMERHDGNLAIDSEKAAGTTVRLIFPQERISLGAHRASA